MSNFRVAQSVRQKLGRAFSASALGPAVTIFVQLVTVPALLRVWGAERYGEWLLLSAIPSYLSMTDMGFGSVAGNEMTMDVASGNYRRALQTFQSTGALVAAASFLALGGVMISLRMVPAGGLLHVKSTSQSEVRTTLLYLSIYSLLSLYNGVIAAGYRCDGNFARGMVMQNATRLAENLAGVTAACLGAGLTGVALTLAAVRLSGTALIGYQLTRLSPWLRFGARNAQLSRIRSLFIPALAFMAFPAGNALSIQGMLLVVGLVLGPVAATTFSTLRTLTRFGSQLVEVVKNATWPELSVAFGRTDFALARRLHRMACQVSFWLSIAAVVFLLTAGGAVFRTWTHARVAFERPVFTLLLCSVVAGSLWSTSSVVALACNSHSRLAGLYVAATSASVLTAYLLTPHLGLIGASGALLVIDLAMCAWTIKASINVLQEHWSLFFKSLFDTSAVLKMVRKPSSAGIGNESPVAG
jgi:O-antigen/teichoic acid export membrane protein